MPFFRTRRRRTTALLALAGLLATSGIASAAASRYRRPVTDAPAPPAATPAPTAPSGSRTMPENPMRETAPGVYEGIVPFRLPDGSWQVDLDERFHQYSVARLTAGGGMTRACTHSAEGLARWRNTAAHAAGTAAACAHAHGAETPVAVASTAKPAPAKGGVAPKVTTPTGAKAATWEVR